MMNTVSESAIPEGDRVLTKCWVALRDDLVVAFISMRVPNDVDFDSFRAQALDCLGMIGEVRVGDIIERDGRRMFLRRLNHEGRGKTPRERKAYEFSPNCFI